MIRAPHMVAFIVELFVVVVVVVGALIVYGLYRVFSKQQSATMTTTVTIEGGFVTAPTTVPVGGSATFVYRVTRRIDSDRSAVAGRVINFTVSPGELTVVPATGTTGTDGLVSVVVTSPANFEGEGQIVAMDAASGSTDDPVRFRVE